MILTVLSQIVHYQLQDSSDNPASVNSPEEIQDTSALARAQQETLTLYKSAPSLQQKVSVCRVSDAGYFPADVGASDSGGTETEEDTSSSEDEDSNGDPPGDGEDPPGDEVNPSAEDAEEPTPSSRQPGLDEQLPESTACADGNVRPGAEALSPDTLLAEDAVPSGKEPRAEREVETHPLSKLNKAMEAQKHFSAFDQPSTADNEADSKEQADASCNEKVEPTKKGMTELVNEGKADADDKGKEGMQKGKTEAEDAEGTRAASENKIKIKDKTASSQPKHNVVQGQSNVAEAFGATAKKQQSASAADAFQRQNERGKLSNATPESDSRKGKAEDASPEADEQPDGDAAGLPLANAPCPRRVDATDVEDPPPVAPWGWAEDAQDLFTIENDLAELSIEDQLVQMLMVHMEPHDYHLPPPPPQPQDPPLPFPIQASEQGRREPAQLAPPGT